MKENGYKLHEWKNSFDSLNRKVSHAWNMRNGKEKKQVDT